MSKQTEIFECPMCKATLTLLQGTKINPKDGVTLYCMNTACPAQEVFGHANNEKNAFEVIKDKYKP